MHSYWTWFDVDVASGLNAHLRYLADVLDKDSCLYVRFLDKAVEIPIHKRCFKRSPPVLSSLIRTSDVGRQQLQKIRETLESEGVALKLRRSTKKKILNQVTAFVPVDDELYPLKISAILTAVAKILGEEMPARVVIGYHQSQFSEDLPGDIHYDSKIATLAYRLGKAIGTKLRNV